MSSLAFFGHEQPERIIADRRRHVATDDRTTAGRRPTKPAADVHVVNHPKL